jgi:predicted dehydrogenase
MTETIYRVGIAGYGVVGKRRRAIIDQHPHLKTVALCDIAFGGSGRMDDGVVYHEKYTQLLEEPLDIIFVSLPNYLSPEVTIAGLEKGLHVFCEKPPGRTVEDIRAVREVEARHPDLRLKYGFNHRYHHSVREALSLVQSGEFGKILHMRGVYGKSLIVPFVGEWRAVREQSGGGILLDQGIHMVDLMRLFAGEFTDVKSFVANDFWGFDVEDDAMALMRSDSGVHAMLHSSATQWQHRFRLELGMEQGYLQLEGLLTGSKSYGQETLVIGRRDDSGNGSLQHRCIKYLEDPSWRDEIFEFADAIKEGKEIVQGTSLDALKTMQLVYSIYYNDENWRNAFNIPYPGE